jgi:hypothetical protein
MAKSLEQLEKENAALKGQVSNLTTKLKVAEAVAPKNTKPVVDLDGDHYMVRGGLTLPHGKKLTAAELAADAKMCASLIKKGSGLFEKVTIK